MSKQKVKMKYNIINKIEEIKESDMHFENVIKVNDHEYITVLSAYQLAELYDCENISLALCSLYSPINIVNLVLTSVSNISTSLIILLYI